jgi:hypothetical protein
VLPEPLRRRAEGWIKVRVPNPRGEAGGPPLARLFPLKDALYRHDPEAYLLLNPDESQHWDWPEHPAGGFDLRTNNLGLVEDAPTESAKSGLRILVAGDSHTQGVVGVAETFPNQLETCLRGAGRERCEVLNAGVAFTGPRCYLQRLRHFLFLEPDAFVAAVFTGNDFWDDLRLAYARDGWWVPDEEAYQSRLRDAAERWPAPVSQGLNQAYRFEHWPGEAERALREVVASFEEMRTLCAERGIVLVALILPTKNDVDEDARESRAAAMQALELDERAASINLELGRALAAALRERGIACVDLTDEMRARAEPFYWTRDHHLALAGNALAAERLCERMDELLPR